MLQIIVYANSGTEVPRYHMEQVLAQQVTPCQILLYRDFLHAGGGEGRKRTRRFSSPCPALFSFFGGKIFFSSLFLLSSLIFSPSYLIFFFSSLFFSSLRHIVTLKAQLYGEG